MMLYEKMANVKRTARHRDLRLQRDISKVLSTSATTKEAVDRVLILLMALDQIDAVGVYIFDHATGRLDLFTHCGFPAHFVEKYSSFSKRSQQARLIKEGHSIWVGHAERPLFPGPEGEDGGPLIKAIFPVTFRGEVLASLHVASRNGEPVFTDNAHILESFAFQLGGLLYLSRTVSDLCLKRDSEEDLHYSESRWRDLVESAPDHIWMLNAARRITYMNRQYSEDHPVEEMIGKTAENLFPAEHRREFICFVKKVFKTGKVVRYKLPVQTAQGQMWFEHRMGPVLRGGEIVAAINTSSDISEIKVSDDLRNKFIAEVLSLQEEDRRRIARELHDEIGQALTSIAIGLQEIQESTDLRAIHIKSEKLQDIASATARESSRLSRGLHPALLDEQGLQKAVEHYVADFKQIHNITVDTMFVELKKMVGLSKSTETAMFRIIQEAMTNVAKHAEAENVSLVITQTGSYVRVVIDDDGVGFDSREIFDLSSSIGLGLKGIKERASLLKGTAAVDSSEGGGTTIVVELPINGIEKP